MKCARFADRGHDYSQTDKPDMIQCVKCGYWKYVGLPRGVL